VPVIASHAPELMTAPLAENDAGTIASNLDLGALAEGKTVIAMGPGMGRNSDVDSIIEFAVERCPQPVVLDADALGWPGLQSSWKNRPSPLILTPHPGEMARLTGKSTAAIQRDRIAAVRDFAQMHGVTLVLKGQRTVLAFPDGRLWVNPTGTPAMGTGGSGDVLTGLIAGFLAQFPDDRERALAAAVYLHGLAGEIGAKALGDKCLIATDLLEYLPDAMEECAQVPDGY
jgi:NAD(P)H-hydrate epimerase